MKDSNVIETNAKGGFSKAPRTGGGAKRCVASSLAKRGSQGEGALPDITQQKFYSVRQVAERWRVSESTVRRLVEEGSLSGIRLRRSCRLSAESVTDYEKNARF